MDSGRPSLFEIRILSSDNYLSWTVQSDISYSSPYFKKGGVNSAISWISLTQPVYWKMPSLKVFKFLLWIYLTCSWKTEYYFLHILLPSSNHSYSSDSEQSSAPVYTYSSESTLSPLYQAQNCSMVTFFQPDSVLFPSPPPTRLLTPQQELSKFPQRWITQDSSVYLILRSMSILDVISRCSNNLIIRSRIALIMAGPSWSNVLIQWNLL